MNEVLRLNTGAEFPRIGFGTWKLSDGAEAETAVKVAIAAGYRLIDTAAIYMNEESVGKAVRECGLPREEILVTTKLWAHDLGYERAKSAYQNSLERLGLDYVDLYLIHWPAHKERLEAWKAMEEMYRDGKVRNIGVSNFTVKHLEELAENSRIVPAVNQIELHPGIWQQSRGLVDYCQDKGIVVEAYSPLAQADILDEPAIRNIAKTYGKTPAQVAIRWCIQHNTLPIPKSANKDRIKENIDVFDFELSDRDMKMIDNISSDNRVTHDPADHD